MLLPTGRGLRGNHDAADRCEDKRDIEHPELRSYQHLRAVKIPGYCAGYVVKLASWPLEKR